MKVTFVNYAFTLKHPVGDQVWNDDGDGHMSGEGQSHMEHGDLNNSARGRRICFNFSF